MLVRSRSAVGSCCRRPRLAAALAPSPPSRSFALTPRALTATPDWQELIGGRAAIQKKKVQFEDKYRAVLENKAKKEGITVEELLARAEVKAKADAVVGPQIVKPPRVVAAAEEVPEEAKAEAPKAAAEQAAPAHQCGGGSKDTGVKPLGDILDLSKAATLDSTSIAALWKTYHQQKGFLSAAIPTATYERMVGVAKKYPLFVLPLARDPTPGAAETEEGAVEMHLLQWAFLPRPPTVLEEIPAPSTVLFTPLAEYQARQSYAQPYLVLSHYADLSRSHNLVLMRGEITDSVALSETDAQVLAVRMQLFYNHAGVGGAREETRKDLLRCFHETPEVFDLEMLVKTAWEID